MDIGQLHSVVSRELPGRYRNSYAGSLEEYLRALQTVVDRRAAERCSYELCACIFRDAFHAAPAPYSESWPADCQTPAPDGFQEMRVTLLCQVIELRRIALGQARRERCEHGLRAIDDIPWSNFDPFSYLEHGVTRFMSALGQPDDDAPPRGWASVAEILELGQSFL